VRRIFQLPAETLGLEAGYSEIFREFPSVKKQAQYLKLSHDHFQIFSFLIHNHNLFPFSLVIYAIEKIPLNKKYEKLYSFM
jgi:hypothetical protein